MIGQHDDASAGSEQLEPGGKCHLKGLQLAVHGDAQGLEHARGWVHPATAGQAARDRTFDDVGEFRRRGDGLSLPGRHHRPGDAPGERLLAVPPEECGQLHLVKARYEIGCGSATGGIEPDVQWARGAKLKPAALVGKLVGAEPKVEEDPVAGIETGFGSDSPQVLEVRSRRTARSP